jgi:RNA polymerase sigma factor (sigma-70 family)
VRPFQPAGQEASLQGAARRTACHRTEKPLQEHEQRFCIARASRLIHAEGKRLRGDGSLSEASESTSDAAAVRSEGSSARPSEELLQALYRAHCAELRRYVHRQFGAGPPEPEDVVHAAFTRFAQLTRSAVVLNPRAFLFRTVRNIVIDERRRERTQERHTEELKGTLAGWMGCEFSPEHVLIESERFRILEGALRGMPARRRAMLLLNRIEGLTCTEIGRRAGVTEAAVRKQIDLALRDCMRALRAGSADGDPR